MNNLWIISDKKNLILATCFFGHELSGLNHEFNIKHLTLNIGTMPWQLNIVQFLIAGVSREQLLTQNSTFIIYYL